MSKEKYCYLKSPVSDSCTYYKFTEYENVSIEIVYNTIHEKEREIWSVEIKKLVNLLYNDKSRFGGKFTINNEEGNLTKEEYENIRKTALQFITSNYEPKVL